MSFDVQMQYIKNVVWKNRERVNAAETPNAEVTYLMYEHVRDYVLEVVDKQAVHNGKIVILGGIQINVEPDDYFEPMLFCVIDEYGKTVDLLPQLKEQYCRMMN